MEPRKRSNIVALTLIGLPVGAIGLANAFPGHEMRRNLYADRAACERDYSPQQCAPNTGSGANTGSGTGVWQGPYYYGDRSTAAAKADPGPGRAGQALRTEISMRGGFGGLGRSAHAGS